MNIFKYGCTHKWVNMSSYYSLQNSSTRLPYSQQISHKYNSKLFTTNITRDSTKYVTSDNHNKTLLHVSSQHNTIQLRVLELPS